MLGLINIALKYMCRSLHVLCCIARGCNQTTAASCAHIRLSLTSLWLPAGSSDADADASRLEALDSIVIQNAQPLHVLREHCSPQCRLGSGATCDVML